MKAPNKDCYFKKIMYLKAGRRLTGHIYNQYRMYIKKEFISCRAKCTACSVKGEVCLKDGIGPASHMFIDKVCRGQEAFLFFDDRYNEEKYLAAYIPKRDLFVFAKEDLHRFLPSLSLENCYSAEKSRPEQKLLENHLKKATDFFAKSDNCCFTGT